MGGLELNSHFDAVGDLDEWDTAVHPILLAVKSHRAIDESGTCARAFHLEGELLRLGHSPNGEVPIHFKSVRTSLYNSRALCHLQTGLRDWQERGWTPMGRLGTPADIGNAVALICSEESGWITGQLIDVDGGASLVDAHLRSNSKA